MSTNQPDALAHKPSTGVSRTLCSGLIGSALVLFGSFGVGWLASVSPLNQDPFFIMMRTEAAGVISSVIMLTLGCWMLVRAWWRLGQQLAGWGGQSYRVVRKAVYLWSAPLLISIPIMSRDVFAYIGQGRLVMAGQDPYSEGISSISNWFQLGTDTMWAEDGTPYGPLYLLIEYLVVATVGHSTDLAILAFRLIAFLGVILCVHYVPKLARLHSVDPGKATWVAVANPLFLLNFVASAHNDSLMVGLAVMAVYLACQRRGVLAVIVLVASIGIKPITLVLLPFVGLLWAGPEANWPKKIRYWFYSGMLLLGLMTLIGFLNGYWFGWLKVMLFTGTGYSIFSPLGIGIMLLGGLVSSFGLSTEWILPLFKLAGRLLGVALAVLVIFCGKYSHLVQRMAIGFSAIVVLSPVIHPWYLLWLLPFFAVTGIRGDWQMLWVYVTVLYFTAYQAADQLFVWQFLADDLMPLLHVLSWGISIAAAAYLVFLDRRTRTVLPQLLKKTAWLKKRV